MTDSGVSVEVVYTEIEPNDYKVSMVALFVVILIPVAAVVATAVRHKV